jgi:ABC-2 type transport system permease protein
MYLLKFVWLAICTNLKLSFALRGAFLITVIVTIIKQLLFLIAWSFFFGRYKVIQGWTFEHMILAYGIVCFAMGVVEAFFYGLKEMPQIIETGQLDTFLLQPKGVILNVALSKGDVSALGEVVAGVLLIAYSGYFGSALLIVLSLMAITTLCMFALQLYLSCIAFFMRNASDFIKELNLNAIIVATQPNAAYSGAFKIFTFTILPVAFLSYFPVEYFRTGLWYYLLITLVGTGVFFGVAYGLFQCGLKRYESGNMMFTRQ